MFQKFNFHLLASKARVDFKLLLHLQKILQQSTNRHLRKCILRRLSVWSVLWRRKIEAFVEFSGDPYFLIFCSSRNSVWQSLRQVSAHARDYRRLFLFFYHFTYWSLQGRARSGSSYRIHRLSTLFKLYVLYINVKSYPVIWRWKTPWHFSVSCLFLFRGPSQSSTTTDFLWKKNGCLDVLLWARQASKC